MASSGEKGGILPMTLAMLGMAPQLGSVRRLRKLFIGNDLHTTYTEYRCYHTTAEVVVREYSVDRHNIQSMKLTHQSGGPGGSALSFVLSVAWQYYYYRLSSS